MTEGRFRASLAAASASGQDLRHAQLIASRTTYRVTHNLSRHALMSRQAEGTCLYGVPSRMAPTRKELAELKMAADDPSGVLTPPCLR